MENFDDEKIYISTDIKEWEAILSLQNVYRQVEKGEGKEEMRSEGKMEGGRRREGRPEGGEIGEGMVERRRNREGIIDRRRGGEEGNDKEKMMG